MAKALATGKKCEGCGKPATGHDLDGVPLCEECGSVAPTAAEANKICRVCGVRIGYDRPHFHDTKGGPSALIHEECAEFEALKPCRPRRPLSRATRRSRLSTCLEPVRESEVKGG